MNLDERLSEIEQWYESTFDSVDGKPLAIGGDLLALAQEYRDELAEAVWLLHKMRRAMREENTTHGVALFDYAGQADAFLARHEGEKHE
jgi:hypothetical protein